MGGCHNTDCNSGTKILCNCKRTCESCHFEFCSQCISYKKNATSKNKKVFICINCYNKTEATVLPGDHSPLKTSSPTKIIEEININYIDPFLAYEKIKPVGRGANSIVFQVKCKEDNYIYALKQIESSKMPRSEILAEFRKSYKPTSPNLLESYSLYSYKQNLYGILLEYMDSTLSQYIKRFFPFKENIIAYILREITRGLSDMHEGNWIHRDVKSDNIFLNKHGDVKIGDFGFAAQLEDERDSRQTLAGTPLWIAPEMLSGKPYNTSCDIWSLGIIAYELIYGFPPFYQCKTLLEMRYRISEDPEPRVSGEWSEDLKQFVVRCLQKDPNNRSTCRELLDSEFLNITDEEEIKNTIKNNIVVN